jgi:hypothetical protein
MQRCRNCQQPLTFAGISTLGYLVYQCTATVFYSDRGGTVHAVPCNPNEDLVCPEYASDGGPVRRESIHWAKRDRKGNVILPATSDDRVFSLDADPALLRARQMAAAIAKLDELEFRNKGQLFLGKRRQAAQRLFTRPQRDGVVYAGRAWRAA